MKVTKLDAHTSGCAELRFAFVVHIKDISTQFILTQVFFSLLLFFLFTCSRQLRNVKSKIAYAKMSGQ